MNSRDDCLRPCHVPAFPVNLMRMRQVCLIYTALLCAAPPVLAQVTVDLQALDALKGARPAAREHATRHTTHKPTSPRQATAAKQGKAKSQATATPGPQQNPQAPTATGTTPPPTATTPAQAATPPPATLPVAPPSTVAIAPVPTPPAPLQAAPPPPPPISDSAASVAAPTGTGLRVTFGAGQSDLSPASAEAIKSVAQSAPPGATVSFNVVAYAAGTPEDPSTARRLSLARALAVRSALMADGIASSRIFVRALGAAAGDDAAPDRVDLAVLGGNASADGAPKSPSP